MLDDLDSTLKYRLQTFIEIKFTYNLLIPTFKNNLSLGERSA